MTSFDTICLPPSLRSLVETELQPGERITWMGQPVPQLFARSAWPIVLFGIPWTAIALFWTGGVVWAVLKSNGPGVVKIFPMFGLPFILVGFGMLSAPFWARRRARQSVYVLTDRRAIVVAGSWRGTITIRSFEPEKLKDLRRTQHKDGSGDLLFSQDTRRYGYGDRYSTRVGFLAVNEVKDVEGMVRALAQKSLA